AFQAGYAGSIPVTRSTARTRATTSGAPRSTRRPAAHSRQSPRGRSRFTAAEDGSASPPARLTRRAPEEGPGLHRLQGDLVAAHPALPAVALVDVVARSIGPPAGYVAVVVLGADRMDGA